MKLTFILLFLSSFFLTFSFAQDWPNLSKYMTQNDSLTADEIDENRVVFMGNSITEGWLGLYPSFFKNKSYINRGISGQTTPQMLVRFRADVIHLHPKVVVILAGTNDIAGNTGPSTLEMIADNIFSMAELAKVNGIKVVLCSVLPVYDYPWKPGLDPVTKIAKLNTMIKEYAAYNCFEYLDYYTAMVNERLGLKADLTYDGVHPNTAGYMVMEPITEAAIINALSK